MGRWGRVLLLVLLLYVTDTPQTVVVGAILQSVAFAIQSARPPFPLMALSYTIGGFGWSLGVAQSNNFIAGLPNGMHAKLMVGHGCYGLGALVAPLVSTQFAQFHKHWSFHYLISLALSLSNVASLIVTFRFRDQKRASSVFQGSCSSRSHLALPRALAYSWSRTPGRNRG